jgi:AbrB family looped-hinge helix DNA binding protein
MAEHTRISSDGEAIIPKEVCERLNWRPGMEIEIDAGGEGLIVRPARRARKKISWEEFRSRMPKHVGPPASLEQMEQAIERERMERWIRKEHSSR